MGSLIVVSGPPGAGKSTISAELAKASQSVLVEGDQFFDFLGAGAIDPWLPESNAQNKIVTAAAAAATGRFAADYATVYDGALGPWFLPRFASATGLASFDYVVLLPTVDECVSRVASRIGHGFTDETATRMMHAEFAGSSIETRHLVSADLASVSDVIGLIHDAQNAGRLHYQIES